MLNKSLILPYTKTLFDQVKKNNWWSCSTYEKDENFIRISVGIC